MNLLSYLLICGLFSVTLAGSLDSSSKSSDVLDLIPDNFDNVIRSGKPALVEFFAPWCGHCKALAPIWEQLGQEFAFAKDKVVIAKVDADAEKSLGERFGIQGFPTITYFDGSSNPPVDYSGARDLESLSDFLTQKTGIRPKKGKPAPSQVVMLNDSTFKTHVNGDRNVIIAFTASWCGHCKKLAPIWEKLAQDFSLEPDVVIAKVDAEGENSKATAKAEGVTSYPTLKFFPKGSTESELYNGGRTEEDFISFLNQKAGTHRTPGGGIDASAGTIESLELLVSKFTAGSQVAEVAVEATKALDELSEGARHWYADYYIRVLNKLVNADDYAVKELARLKKILQKGGLAPNKSDEFTIKTNILRKFIKKEAGKSEL